MVVNEGPVFTQAASKSEKEIVLDQTRNTGVSSKSAVDRIKFKGVLKACCLAVLVVLLFVGLGPARWQPRSGLGWEIDHFAGYFVITSMFCIAWPRPLVVGGALMIFAVALEALQAFMPDRSSYYLAAVYSAAGVLAAALVAEIFIQAWKRFRSKRAVSA